MNAFTKIKEATSYHIQFLIECNPSKKEQPMLEYMNTTRVGCQPKKVPQARAAANRACLGDNRKLHTYLSPAVMLAALMLGCDGSVLMKDDQ